MGRLMGTLATLVPLSKKRMEALSEVYGRSCRLSGSSMRTALPKQLKGPGTGILFLTMFFKSGKLGIKHFGYLRSSCD